MQTLPSFHAYQDNPNYRKMQMGSNAMITANFSKRSTFFYLANSRKFSLIPIEPSKSYMYAKENNALYCIYISRLQHITHIKG